MGLTLNQSRKETVAWQGEPQLVASEESGGQMGWRVG